MFVKPLIRSDVVRIASGLIVLSLAALILMKIGSDGVLFQVLNGILICQFGLWLMPVFTKQKQAKPTDKAG